MGRSGRGGRRLLYLWALADDRRDILFERRGMSYNRASRPERAITHGRCGRGSQLAREPRDDG
jgi:hypothetical protein